MALFRRFGTWENFFLVIGTWGIVLTTGCNSNETGDRGEVESDAVFMDYDIRGDEETGFMSVKAQFRLGGPAGPPLVLESPAGVTFDAEKLSLDSSVMNGAWYETMLPSGNFSGHHSIVFTDPEGKQHKEEFDFDIISLKNELLAVIHRDSLVFELEGLRPGDHIKILFTDTAFYSRGIDRMDTVRTDRILVTREELDNLKNGPVSVEFIKELERDIENPAGEGGKLSISYGIKRVFELRD